MIDGAASRAFEAARLVPRYGAPVNAIIDLRSDTVTRPGEGMRRAMAVADVGDDVYGEDPTAQRLEARVADILGKEAALFVPSGTMANQIALAVLARRGDEVIVGDGAHCAHYESGAGAVIAGVQFANVGSGGLFSARDAEGAIREHFDWYPRTGVVALENTHNRGGGRVWPLAQLDEVTAVARSRSIALHLDGARLWNASVASGVALDRWARDFDTVSVCLSKGLGAPAGSLLASSRERVAEARRWRKRLGGGMRQVGVLAAAGLYALDHHRDRMAEDHVNAKALRAAVGDRCGGPEPETNIVMLDLPGGASAEKLSARAKEHGIRVSAFGPSRVRAVTHLDASSAECARAGEVLARLLDEGSR